MQNLVLPSFFLTKVTGELHGPDDGSITPLLLFSSISLLTSLRFGSGVHLDAYLIGLASLVSFYVLPCLFYLVFYYLWRKRKHTSLADFWVYFSLELLNVLPISPQFHGILFDPWLIFRQVPGVVFCLLASLLEQLTLF